LMTTLAILSREKSLSLRNSSRQLALKLLQHPEFQGCSGSMGVVVEVIAALEPVAL